MANITQVFASSVRTQNSELMWLKFRPTLVLE